MDLRDWIMTDHRLLSSRLADQVLAHVPTVRQPERADGGGSSITFLLWHIARHHDLAVNAVVRGIDPLLAAWQERVGCHGMAPGMALAEAEDRAITEQLDPEGVVGYHEAVGAATAAWLAELDLATLDDVPDAAGVLAGAGVSEAEFPWLHRMWEAKPVSWYISWEAIGHGITHVGEMVSIRNRLGLSPF